nr:GNAT family N-acetyltransferase [Lachnospiraceae bacterium]
MDFVVKPLIEEEEALIEEKINAYADSMAPAEPYTEEEQFVFKAEDEEGNVIGGCVVNIHFWGRAVLAQLWVDGRYRHHGLGSLLIRAAENAAREKGCYYLCLGTADYMARPLYEKHGFRVFTVNKDIPMGHVSWSLSKRLDQGIPDYVPTDNTAVGRCQVRPGSREDAEVISKGLGAFCEEVVPDKHEYIPLSRKYVDADGALIAAVIAGVDEDDTAEIDGIWVEERFRRRGIGSRLFADIECEAKENGAYVLLSYCCDWVSGFFFRNGFTPRGELPDYPKGHTAYELEKRI